MILYRDLQQAERTSPPEWCMDGDGNWAPNLQSREDSGGRLWGIGDAYLLGPYKDGWHDLAGGWQMRVVDKIEPRHLFRSERWVDCEPVYDLFGTAWQAPTILAYSGVRIFRVTYGKDFLPKLTIRQERAEAIANEARIAFQRTKAAGDGVDMVLACQWAAELLSQVHYLTPEVIAAAGILDDDLTIGILSHASAIPIGKLL